MDVFLSREEVLRKDDERNARMKPPKRDLTKEEGTEVIGNGQED